MDEVKENSRKQTEVTLFSIPCGSFPPPPLVVIQVVGRVFFFYSCSICYVISRFLSTV